jgi:long-chain acyl-CoA synthetase
VTVREYSVPAIVASNPARNLTDLVVENATEAPETVVFSRPGEGGWLDITARQFHEEVTALAKGMIAAGIGAGDRVALMAKTRYEWTLTDFAIWFAGAVTVPVYETSSAEQVEWILADSGAVACFVESPHHAAVIADIRDRLPRLNDVWIFDVGAVDELGVAGSGVEDDEIERRRRTHTGESVATLIYTSGTTGRPKGCELTHGNFVDLTANVVVSLASVVKAPGASTLLFLPLAHVFARFIQVLCVASRARMGHSGDVKNLLNDLAGFRPTFILAVPRVFEKIYNGSEARAVAGGKGAIFKTAAETAIAYSEAKDTGGPSLLLRARYAVLDKLVYKKLRDAMGGQVAYAVSGGAPLGKRLGHFFRGVGIHVLEGWGLTETTAPACVNRPERTKIGSVGLPLPGVAVATAEDGELLIKGVNVMKGYHGNPEATAAAIQDGWFRTGDLGEIDDDGFVTITGRKKEILVTANGKNVSPTILEDRLRAHPLISQCIVVGDQKPFIACLVTLDEEMLPTWLANHGKPAMDVAAASQDPDVKAEIQLAVDDANKAVSRAESIRKFEILEVDFTEEGGHLTPKQSLKRQVLLKEFAPQIESLYR